ncbi:aminopeptidase [Collybia nuda]|uniref:Peptide hydrolase n=1 Tax=Collybia nuda TaxID=64659 RepID=A0A9P5Y1Y0_9AGAR|nr:aminopeptidase [Collybia nuda]
MKLRLCLNFILAALVCVHAVPILSSNEIAIKSAQGLRLLSLEEGAEPVWKTEDEKLDLMRASVNFFDVTEVYELEQKNGVVTSKDFTIAATFPAPSHQAALTPILSTVSTTNMQSNLNSLTAFNNRYYKSTTGAQASTWIYNAVKSIASGRSDITVSLYSHSWGQSSIIAKIAGSSASSPVTIVGAHMDSINLSNPTNGRAPGADDDGTGTVNLIEGLRVLVAAGFKPSTPVEYHWYSGEEAGLLGSQAIATAYKNAGTKVKAFMELDMSGYFKPGTKEVMALQADYIDEGLNTFLKALITMYSKIPWAMDIPCGYACSDHASWYKVGVPSSFPYEAITGNDNPTVHSASDTTSVNGFSWAHSLEFAKIGVAFVYEMSV